MRAVMIGMLIATLALWSGQTLAQSPPASAKAEREQPAPAPLALTQAQREQPPPASAQFQHPAPAPQQPPPRYSADSLYNLANSYARAGKPGFAVLNYERAALLAPNDPDINANMDYVRTSAHVPTEPRTRLARVVQAASPTSAAWIGVLGIVLIGAGVLASRMTHRFRWLRTTGILLGLALIALTVCNGMLLWPRMHEAVVLVNQTPARVSPVPMGDPAFVLREAETVTITAEHEDFILVRTRAGLSGWVARANLGAVMPRG
jgi:hypothetical protein